MGAGRTKMFRPLSFTKNLGGYRNLYRIIREAYQPGITLADFGARIPRKRRGRFLVASEFFIASRIVDNNEIVYEDELIRQSLRRDLNQGLRRLYLFALLLNMPGQRRALLYRSPAEAQNRFVRDVLHDGIGWRAERLDPDAHIEPWVQSNVALQGRGAARKFTTNFAYFFEQCAFSENALGYLVTSANAWGAAALRLFFERYSLQAPAADVDELVKAAQSNEVHKLLGVDLEWLSEVVSGAAQLFLEDAPTAVELEDPDETEAEDIAPAGRVTRSISAPKRAAGNVVQLRDWYQGRCQICGNKLLTSRGGAAVDYAHIRPLGLPHNGPDRIGNMLSLCPNHHRQLDRHAIGIRPGSLEILAPHGSTPQTLPTLLVHEGHRLMHVCVRYHFKLFNRSPELRG